MHLSAHSKCVLCNNGEDEHHEHFLLYCPVLSSVRDEYFSIISKQSSDYYIGVDFMESHLVPNYSLLLVILDMLLIMLLEYFMIVSVKCILKHVLDYEVKY
jgi:hypothetical protein